MNYRGREKIPEDLVPEELAAKTKPRRLNVTTLVLTLLAIWLALVHYMERVRMKGALGACQWELWENFPAETAHVEPHRVAIIADPQLVDDHTYPKLPRWANYLLRRLSDNYLYTNYQYLQEHLYPNTTIFIGDLFDGGRDWEDEGWIDEYKRFCTIFPEFPGRKSYRGLPGNHDIGFQNISVANAKRFAEYFGKPNNVYVLGNHTFIQMDTISLLHEDPEVNQAVRAFYTEIQRTMDAELPRILLTHVPLYRDPKVEVCGPGRESKRPFPLQRGDQYQTVIDYVFTDSILKTFRPVLVLSGDDHDYCDTTHVDYSDNTKKLAREISCKTISMTNGIKNPAVQLLSLKRTEGSPLKTYETEMCYLAAPYLGVKTYGVFLLVSLATLWIPIFRPEFMISRLGLSFGVYSPELRMRVFSLYSGILLVAILFLLNAYNKMV